MGNRSKRFLVKKSDYDERDLFARLGAVGRLRRPREEKYPGQSTRYLVGAHGQAGRRIRKELGLALDGE